jgi:hypothetical protein
MCYDLFGHSNIKPAIENTNGLMPLTRAEREEINRAIVDTIERFTQNRRENRGSPADQAFAAGIERGIQMTAGGAQRVSDHQFGRLGMGDRLVGAAIDESLLLATQPKQRRKRKSQFNAAVSEGMKIVRKSTSYGKKGTINNSKKAFTAVTKTVSKARRGLKSPTKGVLRKVFSNARKRMLSEISRKKIPGVARGRQFDFLKKGRK